MYINKLKNMKKIIILSLSLVTLYSCNDKKEVAEKQEVEAVNYTTFGDSITNENVLTNDEMLAKYETMKAGDTLNVKFGADIISTCKKKGCWMTLNLAEGKESFVKFKDYAFFVPKEGAENHHAIVSGKAFIEEISVDELKHYAKDAGKSQQAIDSIVAPEKKLRFMADGVLIAENK